MSTYARAFTSPAVKSKSANAGSAQQWHELRLRWGQRGRLLEVRVLKEGGFACLLGRQHGVRLVRRGHLQSTPNQHASALINPIKS